GAVLAAPRVTRAAPTTNSTADEVWASTQASVTANTGGESRSTQSKFSRNAAINSAKRGEPSSSGGFGGTRPAGRTHSLGTVVFFTASFALALAVSTFDRPAS